MTKNKRQIFKDMNHDCRRKDTEIFDFFFFFNKIVKRIYLKCQVEVEASHAAKTSSN
jgi:hypothetical protein